ncbi:hypothetical protein D9758_006848 [Tetrapyrgos nigripes]|uniref:Inhibitor I9 domain-containing protein n=1 Tax=Tetrapyrgos nigripes TaxID=182062 RepID=A0A8H5CVF2_9AGAR|nr:hypothetical protein D9758_006848 [Tetrapyrgos nigripes]
MSQKFIVTFKDSVSKEDLKKYKDQVKDAGGKIYQEYDGVLTGFAAEIPPQTLESFKSLQGDVIEGIEPDGEVRIQ